MEKLLSLIIPVFLSITISAQNAVKFRNNTIGVNFEHAFNSKIKVSQEAHVGADGKKTLTGVHPSQRALRNYGSIYYIRHLGMRSGIGGEFFAGRINTTYRVILDEDFFSGGVPLLYTNLGNLDVMGLTGFYSHQMTIKDNAYFHFSLGISGVWVTPESISSGYGVRVGGQTHWYYTEEVIINKNRRIVPALYLDVGYNYSLSPLISIKAAVFMRHSNSSILETETPYQLVGTNDIVEGNFNKNFSHFGWKVGFSFNFGTK